MIGQFMHDLWSSVDAGFAVLGSDDLKTNFSSGNIALPVRNKLFRGSYLNGFVMLSAGLLGPCMKPTLDISCVL